MSSLLFNIIGAAMHVISGPANLPPGSNVTVRTSTRAYPPGATASGTLHGANTTHFAMKVAGSRKEPDGFVVRGRLVNATVAIRGAFAEAGAPKP